MSTTSSSTSGSRRPPEIGGADDPRWRGFLRTLVGSFAVLLPLTVFAFVALDPADTGRLALVSKPGIVTKRAAWANASRGRDQAFSAAIFGNSHMEEIAPARLSAATGRPFVSLIVPGSGAAEQLLLLDYFVRRHPKATAIVIGIDDNWCVAAAPKSFVVPRWLYDRSNWAYITGLFRYASLLHVSERLQYLAGWRRRSARDGFLDYDPIYSALEATAPKTRSERLREPYSSIGPNPSGTFPFAQALLEQLDSLPATTAVVLLRPPLYITGQPAPGSPSAAAADACTNRFRDIARRRPRTALLDWRGDRPENRDMENFFDHEHYRAVLAPRIEADIADLLEKMF